MKKSKIDLLSELSVKQQKYIAVLVNEKSTKTERNAASHAMGQLEKEADRIYFGNKLISDNKKNKINAKVDSWLSKIKLKDIIAAEKLINISNEYSMNTIKLCAELDKLNFDYGQYTINYDEEVLHNQDGIIEIVFRDHKILIQFENYGASFGLILSDFTKN